MTEHYVEYCEINREHPLRQGDILEATAAAALPWNRHLFVVTADCDFAHTKHQGRVTCIPLLRAEEYLLLLQVPKMRERLIKGPLKDLRAVFDTVGRTSISDRRAREWASEQSTAAIVTTLGLDGQESARAQSAIDAIRLMDAPVESLRAAVATLVEAQVLEAGQSKRDKVARSIISELRQVYKSPPGDALFLGAIAPAHEDGYFAYLRHIEQIWEPQIVLSAARQQASYRRISHLKDKFTHALVQRFALVFMSIGLPDEYEEMRDFHSVVLGDSLQ
ncbi:hypothetical protein [Cryptosporangium arvum]|uniref:Uncharacterized protein n=1 Tax=Cryptosporangium arvum DSM 44712 TaxID=927661 RepID=A0A011AIN2_9ACTN|nr:hypothetical protein [Cryptosporangium arvum]EXG81876.1 hypothetical protein CryarDRAFT_2997 [Cryptosporangium arvum DSM 44712]